MERLGSHRFIVRQEIRALIRQEQQATGDTAPQPDRKSITRMVEQLERADRLKRVILTLPMASNKGTKAVSPHWKSGGEMPSAL